MREKIFQQIKKEFSVKIYFLICSGLAFITVFQPISGIAGGKDLYIYQIGMGIPWLIVYKNVDLGVCNFIDLMRTPGYRGIEWFPQNLLILVGIGYAIYIWLKLAYKKYYKQLVRMFGR